MQTAISRIAQSTRCLAFGLASAGSLMLAGCGAGSIGSNATNIVKTSAAVQGHVFGGQQPVANSLIQLYAASQVGYGVNSTPLVSTTVLTDSGGNFSITGTYTCPYPTSQVYLTATGGNSGSGTNTNIAMMVALGSCGNLSASTQVNINELTTVASAYALSPFMSSPTQLSTSATNLTGLINAAATVNKLVNTATGNLPGTTLPATASEPVALLNTLADILASCINSNGVGGTSTNCASLFTSATPAGGTAPTDTITAMLNIAKNPANNTGTLFALTPPNSPFQPTLASAPSAFTVALRYAPAGLGAFSAPSASAVDSTGNVWVTNTGNNTLSVVDATTAQPIPYSGGGLSAPSAIAFDSFGNAWVPNRANNSLSVFTPAGVGTSALSGLSGPSAVAIDGQGTIWVTNSTSNSVSAVTASRTNVTGSITYYSIGGTAPTAVAINPR